MPQHNVAAVSLGAVDRVVILENVLRRVGEFVGEHAAVAADHFHVQLARLNLAVVAVAESLKAGSVSVGVDLAALAPPRAFV